MAQSSSRGSGAPSRMTLTVICFRLESSNMRAHYTCLESRYSFAYFSKPRKSKIRLVQRGLILLSFNNQDLSAVFCHESVCKDGPNKLLTSENLSGTPRSLLRQEQPRLCRLPHESE